MNDYTIYLLARVVRLFEENQRLKKQLKELQTKNKIQEDEQTAWLMRYMP